MDQKSITQPYNQKQKRNDVKKHLKKIDIKRIGLILTISIFFLASCSPTVDSCPETESMSPPGEHENACFDFIQSKMITEQGGVRTNYLDQPHQHEYAVGHEVLSESMGLLMLYAAAREDEKLFERAYGFVQSNLDTGDLISYRYDPDGGVYHVNAFVDDMRIVSALLLAEDVFGGGYIDEALALADRLYKTNVADGYVYDIYDEEYKIRNDFVTLCYIDLYTIQLLSQHDAKWCDVYETMLDVVKEGYISDTFPMYAKSYSYETLAYKESNINMVEATLTVLNLAYVGECPQQSIDFLKQTISKGPIYGMYDTSGNGISEIESTAIYAICAQIAKVIEDEEMQSMCIEKMNRFQVLDETSEVYGAFANAKTLDLYSFDNMMALIALGQRKVDD